MIFTSLTGANSVTTGASQSFVDPVKTVYAQILVSGAAIYPSGPSITVSVEATMDGVNWTSIFSTAQNGTVSLMHTISDVLVVGIRASITSWSQGSATVILGALS